MTRPYEDGDAPVVADLLNAVEAYGGGHPNATETGVREFVSHLVRQPVRDMRLVLTGTREPVAFAVVTTPQTGATVIRLPGGVHPRSRGRGIGRELLRWQLTRAREIWRAHAPDATWQVRVGVLLGDESAIRLYGRFGMSPVRYWSDMVAPTAGASPVPPPDGIRMERYSPAYEAALHAAHMEAFTDHWGFEQRPLEAWTPLTVRSERFAPALSLLALDGDEIAGYLLAYDDADPQRLYVGQVGVRKPWRRRGLAASLLGTALAGAAHAGRTHAALGVDADHPAGAVGVYERAGFTVLSRAVTYALTLPAGSSEGQVSGAGWTGPPRLRR